MATLRAWPTPHRLIQGFSTPSNISKYQVSHQKVQQTIKYLLNFSPEFARSLHLYPSFFSPQNTHGKCRWQKICVKNWGAKGLSMGGNAFAALFRAQMFIFADLIGYPITSGQGLSGPGLLKETFLSLPSLNGKYLGGQKRQKSVL